MQTKETSNTTSTSERPITFSDEPNAVTIRISGKAFENLREIAAIFNRWDEGNNTPADIARRFMCDGEEWRWLDEKKPDATFMPQTLCGLICDCFSECDDMPELEKAFETAGVSVQR